MRPTGSVQVAGFTYLPALVSGMQKDVIQPLAMGDTASQPAQDMRCAVSMGVQMAEGIQPALAGLGNLPSGLMSVKIAANQRGAPGRHTRNPLYQAPHLGSVFSAQQAQVH